MKLGLQTHGLFIRAIITKEKGYLSYQYLPIHSDLEVYLCGPRVMVNTLVKSTKKQHPDMPNDYEAFAFKGTIVEDALSLLKKVLSFLMSLINSAKSKA